MVLLIMLNMTPFYVEKKDVPVVSQTTPCVVPMHPTLGCTGTLFTTHLTLNISKSTQDLKALESLKCRYYIEVQQVYWVF